MSTCAWCGKRIERDSEIFSLGAKTRPGVELEEGNVMEFNFFGIKRLWSKNYDPFDAKKLKEEIADAFVLLAALAHEFDIDIEQAVREKFIEKDSTRQWKSAERAAHRVKEDN